MRYAVLLWIAVVSCSNPESPPTRSTLETDATSYVASPSSAQGFDYTVSVDLTLRNTSDMVVRVYRCTTTTTYPVYAVEFEGSGGAAWSPNVTCAPFQAPHVDLRPGETHSETIELRAPWQRLFNGQPLGAIEGSFSIILETEICAEIRSNGLCLPQSNLEYVKSNTFTVRR
jgi:hypothetical protein